MSNLAFAGRHSMDSPEWYTPSPFVEAAREVMGDIDLDPASSAEANEIVDAFLFYTEQDNGLEQPWLGRVFVNPPGELVDEFWKKFLAEQDNIEQMIWVGYSLEQLQSLQKDNAITPLDFSICFPKRRIGFVENEAKKALRVQRIITKGEATGASKLARKAAANCRLGKPPRSAPSHANYIAYVGPNVAAFTGTFSVFGKVRA